MTALTRWHDTWHDLIWINIKWDPNNLHDTEYYQSATHLVVEVPGDEGRALRDAGDDAPERHAPALVHVELPGLRPAPRHLDPGCDHPELEAHGQLGQGGHLALVQARVPLPHLPDGQAPDVRGRGDGPDRLESPDTGRVSICSRNWNHLWGFRWNDVI